MDKETFEKYESKACKLIVNSRKMNRLSSAYLLYGQRNAPLLDTALFIAKSLGCERGYLACDECDSCKRFNNGVHPDFVLIDGQNQRIKKEDIQNLETKFSKSAFEKNHRLCYVINRIENITEIAANTILKFLEEPKEGQVAILTTYNLEKVLKTIRSRSIEVRIDPIDPKALMEELENTEIEFNNDGKKKKKENLRLSAGECYVLSQFFSDKKAVLKALNEDTSFHEGYQMAEDILNALATSKAEGAYSILRQTSQKHTSTCYNWMYLTIHDVFAATLLDTNNEDNPFHDIIDILRKDLRKVKEADDIVKEALAYQHVNYNQTLLAARLAKVLIEEKKI